MNHIARSLCLTAPAAALAPALTAAPPSPPTLAPSSPWRLDYSDDSCRLIRTFGEGESKTHLVMDRYSPGDEFALLVAGKPIQSAFLRGGALVRVKLTFGPSEAGQIYDASPATFDDLPGFVLMSANFAEPGDDGDPKRNLAVIAPQREAAVRTLTVSAPSRKIVTLELGSMAKPMAGMRTCIDELMTHWGMDVTRYAARTADAIPKGNPGTWIRPSDYPHELAERGHQGIVHFRLMVGPDGKPASCHIQRSTRHKEFEDAVCNGLMRRASFTPALDAAGQPFMSFFQTSVRFQIAN